MTNIELLDAISQRIENNPCEFEPYKDYFEVIKAIAKDNENEDRSPTYPYNSWLRERLNYALREYQTNDFYGLLKQTYLWSAKDNFSDYMVYLEWNREPHERFYLPRIRVMKPLADAIQMLVDDKIDELFLSMPPRIGKALANDTPILTPNGWIKHGDLRVGDKVFRPNGDVAEIININPKCQMTHRVTMTDGSTFDCHENHEWMVYDRRYGEVRVYETKKMIGHLHNGGVEQRRGHRYNFQLLQKNFLKGEHKHLDVDPYTLGVWLGDGTNDDPRITGDKKDNAIIDKICSNGYEISHVYEHKTTGVMSTEFKQLRFDLQKLGFCYSRKRVEKYIPVEYLTADIDQRLELLAGLLDTDGCLVRKEKRYSFTTSEEKLKDTFITLVSTFGWRLSVKECNPIVSSSGIIGKKKYWVIAFNPTTEIPCVLERKQLKEFIKQRRIAIKSIEPLTEYVEGNCISLNVEDGMYLAGERLTPTHNTTMLLFLATWLIGRDSEKSNLYSGFSDTITSAFFNGVLEIINDPDTYLWHDVFPTSTIVFTNSKEEVLDIDRKKRFHTLTCRSLYGTLNGACNCDGFLICDDLIGGIEEALNKDRLVSAWSKVDNNLIPRVKEKASDGKHSHILWCGTRWSVSDPAGNRMEMLEHDKRFSGRRYKIINVPALNHQGQSNFDYDYGVGFTTEFYQQRRASFEHMDDMASWDAQYMGQPVERSGRLFEPSDLNYYNGDLPDDEHLVRKFMAVDPAFGGGDYTSAPIAYQYDDGNIYIVDVVYNNGDKRITQPIIAKKIVEHELKAVQFEATRMTMAFKEKVEELVHAMGYKCNIMTKSAPTTMAKEYRIFDKAPEIKDLYFLEGDKRSGEYEQFMDNVMSFSLTGKNKHDDAPDSLAMLIEMTMSGTVNVKVKSRRF